MTYAFCNHEIHVGDDVLFVYPEGDCDTGRITEIHPFDAFGTVTVYFDYNNRTLHRTCVENVGHLYCDEDE